MADPEQRLILVDPADRVLGSLGRTACHAGEGRLHRAFSSLIFDGRGRLLIQQRSSHKQLWPGFWSNSCCGHPLEGEPVEAAAERRLEEELGFRTTLRPAFKFEYSAPFGEVGAERELCAVFIGRHEGEVRPAADEISAWRWEPQAALTRSLEQAPGTFTPWFRVIWRVLTGSPQVWRQTRDGV